MRQIQIWTGCRSCYFQRIVNFPDVDCVIKMCGTYKLKIKSWITLLSTQKIWKFLSIILIRRIRLSWSQSYLILRWRLINFGGNIGFSNPELYNNFKTSLGLLSWGCLIFQKNQFLLNDSLITVEIPAFVARNIENMFELVNTNMAGLEGQLMGSKWEYGYCCESIAINFRRK